jgi:hypothetical protein
VNRKISDNTALKQYNMNDLDHLDDLSSSVDDVKTATTKLRIYNMKTKTKPPPLKTLQPTDDNLYLQGRKFH